MSIKYEHVWLHSQYTSGYTINVYHFVNCFAAYSKKLFLNLLLGTPVKKSVLPFLEWYNLFHRNLDQPMLKHSTQYQISELQQISCKRTSISFTENVPTRPL